METDAHDVTATVLCKRDNCDRVSAGATRGRYAGLCDHHTEAARLLAVGDRALRAPAARTIGDEEPPPPAPGKRLSQVAAELVKPAKALESAIGRRRDAGAEARRCLSEFNDALNAVKATAEALLR